MILGEKLRTIKTAWASDTTNKLDLTDSDIAQGILYKGPIVSNQLNGMGNDIYSRMQERQYTGELYDDTLIYDKGNYVTFWWKPNYTSRPKLFYARAVQNGLINNPPVLGGSFMNDSSFAIPGVGSSQYSSLKIFSGGELNRDVWDIQETAPLMNIYKLFEMTTLAFINIDHWGICSFPLNIEAKAGDDKVKIMYFDGYLLVTMRLQNTGSTTIYGDFFIPLKIKATYLLGQDASDTTKYYYTLPLEFPYVELNYGEITCINPQKFYAVCDSKYTPYSFYPACMPFSSTIIMEKTTDKVNLSIVGLGNIKNIVMQGTGNITITGERLATLYTEDEKVNLDYKEYLSRLAKKTHFTIRPLGGTNVMGEIGSLVVKPFNQWGGIQRPVPLIHGCLPLTSLNVIETLEAGWNEFTPVWSLFDTTYRDDFEWHKNLIKNNFNELNENEAVLAMGNEKRLNLFHTYPTVRWTEANDNPKRVVLYSEWYVRVF